MSKKRIHLPKEGFHRPDGRTGPGEQFIDGTDVEGHGWTNPAPPIDLSPRMPTHGGELFPTDAGEDVED